MPEITITGYIDGEGRIGHYQQNALKDFGKNNPNERLIITFRAEKKKSKNALLSYYYAAIIPAWHKALSNQGTFKSTEQVDNELRQLFPLTRKDVSLSALSYENLVLFMETVRLYALEDLNLVFQDPICL